MTTIFYPEGNQFFIDVSDTEIVVKNIDNLTNLPMFESGANILYILPNEANNSLVAVAIFYITPRHEFVRAMIVTFWASIAEYTAPTYQQLTKIADAFEVTKIILYKGNTTNPVLLEYFKEPTMTDLADIDMLQSVPIELDNEPTFKPLIHYRIPLKNKSYAKLVAMLADIPQQYIYIIKGHEADQGIRKKWSDALKSNSQYYDGEDTHFFVDSETQDLPDLIMDPENSVLIGYKKYINVDPPIFIDYINSILVFRKSESFPRIIITALATFFDFRQTEDTRETFFYYDDIIYNFKFILDYYIFADTIYMYAAITKYADVITTGEVPFHPTEMALTAHPFPEVPPFEYPDTDAYQIMEYKRAKPFPRLNAGDADFQPSLQIVHKYIPEDATVHDLINLTDVPIQEYLNEDGANIIFAVGNAFYPANRDQLRDLLFTNHVPNYRDLFYSCDTSFNLTNYNSTSDMYEIYYNMRKMGIPAGFVHISQLFKVLSDAERIFNLESTEASLISTVSVWTYNAINPDYVSSAHCQEGQGGPIYEIQVVTTEPIKSSSHKRKLTA